MASQWEDEKDNPVAIPEDELEFYLSSVGETDSKWEWLAALILLSLTATFIWAVVELVLWITRK